MKQAFHARDHGGTMVEAAPNGMGLDLACSDFYGRGGARLSW